MKFLGLLAVLIFGFVSEVQAYTLSLTEDSYIEARYNEKGKSGKDPADVTHGVKRFITVKKIYEYAYIKFTLKGLLQSFPPDAVVSATLRLYIKRIGKAGNMEIKLARNNWSEGTLVYDNAPDLFNYLDHKVYLDPKEADRNKHNFIFIDITEQLKYAAGSVKSDESPFLSFALFADENLNVDFSSKEDGMHPPEIEVLLGAVEVTEETTP